MKRSAYPRMPLVVVGFVGAALIFIAWFLSSDFAIAVLINLGTATMLFSALYVVQRSVLERRVESIELQTQETGRAVEAVSRTVDEVRQEVAVALESLGEATRQHVVNERELDEKAIANFEAGASFDTAWDLFERADDLRAISPEGVRVALPLMYNRLRFQKEKRNAETSSSGGDERAILLTLETLGGEGIAPPIVWISPAC
jgi:hypothetical protein